MFECVKRVFFLSTCDLFSNNKFKLYSLYQNNVFLSHTHICIWIYIFNTVKYVCTSTTIQFESLQHFVEIFNNVLYEIFSGPLLNTINCTLPTAEWLYMLSIYYIQNRSWFYMCTHTKAGQTQVYNVQKIEKKENILKNLKACIN